MKQMKRSISCVFFFVLLWGGLLVPGKYVAAGTVTEIALTVKQNFENKSNRQDGDFTGTYELHASEDHAPMPGSRDGKSYLFSLKGEEAEIKLHFSYKQTGTYHYQLIQTTKEKKGYGYDRSCYQITVSIQKGQGNQGIPQIVVEKEDGKKYGELSFLNTYEGSGEEDPKEPGPGEGTGEREPVKTGDQSKLWYYGVLGIGAWVMMGLVCFLKKQAMRK